MDDIDGEATAVGADEPIVPDVSETAEPGEAHQAVPDEPTPSQMDLLIERWFADHFPGSAVARDTQAWNVAHEAKEALKRLLS